MENNTYLIYGLNGGTIKDLKLSFSGEAAGLAAVSVSSGTLTAIGATVENVDTVGYVNLTADDQSNYSPYLYCAPQGGLTMKNCTNGANITGNIYGGIFYGYYPINRGANDDIVFDGCVNTANVTMRNASMFFGNPSVDDVMASADEGFTITIKNCRNEGVIRGTVSAHYFVSSLSQGLAENGISKKIEETILGRTTETITPHIVENNSLLESKLLVGPQLEGFAVSVDTDKSITITAPTNVADREAISYYMVSVSSYVTLYDELTKETGGTDRYSVTEDVYPSSTDETTISATLKFYGAADDNYREAGTPVFVYPTRSDDNNVYYSIEKWSDGELFDGRYQRFAHATEGQDITPSFVAPSFLTVTAFDENNQIVGITSYEV